MRILKTLASWRSRRRKAVCSILIILCILFAFPLVLRVLPFPALTEFCARSYSCRVYDRGGQLLQVTPVTGGGRREFTPLEKIPEQIKKDFISKEDRRFYFHHGVDWGSAFSALILNKRSGKIVRGGSTITMQSCLLCLR